MATAQTKYHFRMRLVLTDMSVISFAISGIILAYLGIRAKNVVKLLGQSCLDEKRAAGTDSFQIQSRV